VLWIRGGLKKGTEVSDDLRIPVYSLEITCCLLNHGIVRD
jgi:hypothetical protein